MPTPEPKRDIAAYKAALAATTPGEWEYDESDGQLYAYQTSPSGFARKDVVASPDVSYPEIGTDPITGKPVYDTDDEGEPYVNMKPEDATFIVEAHNVIVPDLLTRCESAESDVARVEGERDALYAMLSDELTKRESAESQRDHARRMVEAAITEAMRSDTLGRLTRCPSPIRSLHDCPHGARATVADCRKCWSDYLDRLAREGIA